MDHNLLSAQPIQLRRWLSIVLLLVTLQVGSPFSSWGRAIPPGAPDAGAVPAGAVPAAAPTPAPMPITMRPAAVPMPAPEGIPAAVHAAELLVTELWQATATPEAPLESLQWLAAYFEQGWAPEIAMELAAYYSYFDGTHYYLRATGDILPPLYLATTVTIERVGEQAVVVEAQFPALSGPVTYPALTRSYSLIEEDGIWKIERIRLGTAHPPDTRSASGQIDA